MHHKQKKRAATQDVIDEEFVGQQRKLADQLLEEIVKKQEYVDLDPVIKNLEMILDNAPHLVNDVLRTMLAECYWFRGNALYEADHTRYAYQDFKKLASLKSERKDFQKYIIHYVDLLKKMKRTTPADEYLVECIKGMKAVIEVAKNSTFSEIAYNLAIQELKVIRKIAPDLSTKEVNELLASAYYYRGFLRKKMGRDDLALKDYLKAKQLLPGNKTIAKAVQEMRDVVTKADIGLFTNTSPADVHKPIARRVAFVPALSELKPAPLQKSKSLDYLKFNRQDHFYQHQSQHLRKSGSFNNDHHFKVNQPGGRMGGGKK